MVRKSLQFVCLFVLAILLIGCGSDVRFVIIEPASDTIDTDEELLLTAIGYAEDRSPMALDTKAKWSLNDQFMGKIYSVEQEQAIFIPEKEGLAIITVKVGKATSSLKINVGEKIEAIRASNYVSYQGILDFPSDTVYPCITHYNKPDNHVLWEFTVPRNAYYTPVILYASEESVERSLSLGGVNEVVFFSATGGTGTSHQTWQMMTLDPIFLEAGKHSLKLENRLIADQNSLNLVWIALVYPIELTRDNSLITTVNKILDL